MGAESTKKASNIYDPLLKAIDAGHAAVLVTGNMRDLALVNDDEIAYRPEFILDQLHGRGYVVIRYSKSQGGRIHKYSGLGPKEKQAIDSRLNAVGIMQFLNRDGQNSPEEIRSFFRASARLLQTPAGKCKPFAVVIDYAEHLAPAVQTSAAAAEEHTFVAESLHMLANAPALRKSGNLLICFARDGFHNSMLNDMRRVEYPFPDESQTEGFIQCVLSRKDGSGQPHCSALEEGFTQQDFARLTRGLRLRDIEAMLRESRAGNVPLGRSQVLSAKAESILRDSEGTLGVMSTSLTLDDIVGLEAIKRLFTLIAGKLKAGDSTSPRSILMVGPPGTSKSTFAPILADLCGFNILQFQNVKNMYVGESERRLRHALSLAETLAPTVLFIDEITEAIPSRNAQGDSGVSLDLLGQLFRFSARDELRGRVLLLGASNVPERLDPAWHDRFIFVPFLELLPHEMRYLFGIFQHRVTGKNILDPDAPEVIEAAEILHSKGASPRKVLDVTNHALLLSTDGSLSPGDILTAARDYVGSANPMAVAYTSLTAISLTSFHSYLPWSLDPENYIYPWYLEGAVDRKTGVINREELHKRIQEYRRHTNL